MPRRAMSTAYRIAGFYAATFAAATLFLGIAAYLVAHRALQHQLDQRVAGEMAELQQVHERGGLPGLLETVAAREKLSARNLGYMITDPSGRRLSGELNTDAPPKGWSYAQFLDAHNSDDTARVLAVALPGGYRLAVGADPEPIEEIDETIVQLFALVFGLMLIAGVAGSYVLGGLVKRRLDEVSQVANAIIDGDLNRRMPVSASGDEFDRLSATLNRMLDRIQSLMAKVRQASSDIAHDLRTPLTRMRQQIEAALAAHPSPKDRATLEEASDNIDQVLSLFSAILRIAEVEAGALRRTFKAVDLSGLTQAVTEGFGPPAEDCSKQLSAEVEDGIVVPGDRDLLAQALSNLLDNALAHTPAGTRISVGLTCRDGEARLSVIDNGPGVPDAERERLLERFTRLEHSRSSPGHGLGLSLVAAVAAAHGGDVSIENGAPGLIVRLSLPVAKRAC